MRPCEPLCRPSVCDCRITSEANIRIEVSSKGAVFVTLKGEGEAYIVGEDFVEVIKDTNTDVFDGKHTFNFQ